MYSKEVFSHRLRELRKAGGLTVQAAADSLGVPKPTYSHWEMCDREPPYAVLCQLADFYGVSTDYLLGQTNHKKP